MQIGTLEHDEILEKIVNHLNSPFYTNLNFEVLNFEIEINDVREIAKNDSSMTLLQAYKEAVCRNLLSYSIQKFFTDLPMLLDENVFSKMPDLIIIHKDENNAWTDFEFMDLKTIGAQHENSISINTEACNVYKSIAMELNSKSQEHMKILISDETFTNCRIFNFSDLLNGNIPYTEYDIPNGYITVDINNKAIMNLHEHLFKRNESKVTQVKPMMSVQNNNIQNNSIYNNYTYNYN